MKRYKLLTAAVLIGATLGTSACDEDLAEINENPNAPTDVPAQYLLPEVQHSTVNQWYYSWFNLEFTGAFAQHWAKIQYTEEDQYQLRTAVVDGWWDGMYAQDQQDWKTIIEKGRETGLVNHEAIGMIGKVYSAHFMTDIWGNIPYSEALKADDPENPTSAPSYDSQQAIYDAMISDLETAVGMLDPSGRSFGEADLWYGGDTEAWERFANSLRLRLLMRTSDVRDVSAQVAAVASQPLIVENSQNGVMPYVSSPPNNNPLNENWKTRDDHVPSITLINLMGQLNDPRLPLYAEAAQADSTSFTAFWCDEAGDPYEVCHVTMNGSVYRGMRNGVDEPPTPYALYSRIGDTWRANGASTPALLVSAAEVHFLLAEAALRGMGVGGTAAGHYEAGIRAAFDMWDGYGVDLGPTVADAYIAAHPLTGSQEEQLEQIIEQKWLALYTNGPEAFAEYRRTGYPDEITPSADALLSYVPDRIPYPSLEQSLNRENWSAAVDAQPYVDNGYGGALWWDPEGHQ